ncbi:MAG: hypothetical protein ACUVXI_05275 [bacterium]
MEGIDSSLLSKLSRFEPSGDVNIGLAKLLLAASKRELTKYKIMDGEFSRKYKMSFWDFKASFMRDPTFEVEQNYFDWELAITRVEEIEAEIKEIKRYLPE